MRIGNVRFENTDFRGKLERAFIKEPTAAHDKSWREYQTKLRAYR